MKLTLVIATEGPWKGKGIAVTPVPFVIGRDPQCHLRPASNAISQRHCTISLRDGKFFFRDLGSTNGCLVNNRLVKGTEVPLAHGDRLTLGNLVFVARIDKPLPVAAKTPTPGKASSSTSSSALGPKAPPRAPGGTDEDSVAELLLSGTDEEGKGGTIGNDAVVPDGTTEMRLPTLAEEETRKDDKPQSEEKSKSKSSKGGKPPSKEDTGAVAAELLKSYLRRLREESDDL